MTEKTNKHECVVYITKDTKRVELSNNWFVLKPDDAAYTPETATFRTLINGKATFEMLYEKIRQAEQSVDIAIWGFQPSMYFKRSGSEDQNSGEEILCIGDLLAKKIIENPDFKVRILVWSMPGDIQTLGEDNLGNKPGSIFANGTNEMTAEQKKYDANWYRAISGELGSHYENLRELVRINSMYDGSAVGIEADPASDYTIEMEVVREFSDKYRYLLKLSQSPNRTNLQYKTRSVNTDNQQLDDDVSFGVSMALEYFASHHQKSVLIDYENPAKAIGFILEHNMLDSYWDSNDHFYLKKPNDPKVGTCVKTPLQDVSCMVSGQVLWMINHNFCQSWDRPENKPYNNEIPTGQGKSETKPLTEARSGIQKEQFTCRNEAEFGTKLSAQVLRTYDQPYVRDIKHMYLQNIKKTTSYIYTENQYFHWPKLVEEFIKHWKALKSEGRQKDHPLYWFAVTNSTDAGMGKATETTYEMLKKLGKQNLMPIHYRNELEYEADQEWHKNHEEGGMKARWEATLELSPQDDANHQKLVEILRAKIKNVPGIKCHVCTLGAQDLPQTEGSHKHFYGNTFRSYNKLFQQDDNPSRETYIHSKVTIIDDVCTFIGSANLNERSMNADTELGIVIECKRESQKLRQELWRLHTQKEVGSEENPNDISFHGDAKKVFNKWEHLIRANNGKDIIPCPLREFIYTKVKPITVD